MISVIIPTEGIEQPVVATLSALVPGAAAGVVKEVVLVDPGTDAIVRVADVAGCDLLKFDGPRAAALAAGARKTRAPWLLFLHPGAVLDSSWIDEAAQFMQMVSASGQKRAGIFRYARAPYSHETGLRHGVRLVSNFIAGPSVDQGLLISRDHYEQLGGHVPTSRRAEAKLLSKLGRAGRALLRTRIFVAA